MYGSACVGKLGQWFVMWLWAPGGCGNEQRHAFLRPEAFQEETGKGRLGLRSCLLKFCMFPGVGKGTVWTQMTVSA